MIGIEKIIENLTPWQKGVNINWDLSQIKNYYTIILGKMLQPDSRNSDDKEVPYLRAINVQWGRIDKDDIATMWASGSETNQLRIKKGDLLVCEGGEVGRAAIVEDDLPDNCIIQNSIHLVHSRLGNIKFLYYLLYYASNYGWLDVLCNRSTIAHFTVEKFSQMWAWFPPLEQQQAIASYLDQKTSTIDQLIEAKQRLIGLLNEKRQALITHAITRGIDHQAPLKDSGVEWIGEIPAHWEIKKLNSFLYSIQQGWSPLSDNQPADKNEWGVLKVGAVNNWTFNPEENKKLPEELNPLLEYQIYDGDVLISRANTTQLLGSISIVEGVNDRKLLLCDKIYRISLIGVDKKYIFYYLRSKLGRALIEENANGASNSMQNISQEDIKNILLTIPSLAEQTAIVAYIERETQKLDALKTAAERTIELLRERRSALIHAAVTGQIAVG